LATSWGKGEKLEAPTERGGGVGGGGVGAVGGRGEKTQIITKGEEGEPITDEASPCWKKGEKKGRNRSFKGEKRGTVILSPQKGRGIVSSFHPPVGKGGRGGESRSGRRKRKGLQF